MIPSFFFRPNLLVVALLLALGLFSSSEGFTAPTTTTTTTVRVSPNAPFARSPPLASPSTSSPRFMSTVTEAPAETKRDTGVEILKDQDTEKEPKSGKNGWEVQLFNDPYNHRTFVAKCLCTICGKSDTESYQIMMQAHRNGMGVVGRYHYEIAELYYGSLKKEGLTVRMVEVDDE